MLKIGNIKIRISPVMLGCILLWSITGQFSELFTVLAAVAVHECAHIVTASLLGIGTEEVELYPFGGAARMDALEDKYALGVPIAFAGPAVSVMLGAVCGKLGILPRFASVCYSVAAVNLLPVYPLDGGRIVDGLLKSIAGAKKGSKYTRIFGMIFVILFDLFCIFDIVMRRDSTYSVMALFVTVAYAQSRREVFRPDKREKIFTEAENVKIIKAFERENVYSISKRFCGNGYYIVLVTDETGNVLGALSEREVFDALMRDSTRKAETLLGKTGDKCLELFDGIKR